jgi:peptidoglycan/xylan/chitin deacetylase (PgdA/CDA1 family)
MQKVCSISIDIDSLDCYYKIHGISAIKESNIVYEQAISRFLTLLNKFGFKATFFVVARDAQQDNNHEIIKEIVRSGHRIGNHTWSHPYNLTRLSSHEVKEEIERAHLMLQGLSDIPVTGFRSPGYNINADIISCLKKIGYTYDSSVFPIPVCFWLLRCHILPHYILPGGNQKKD